MQVDGVGFGMLRFFGAAGVDSQCGVELEEPLVRLKIYHQKSIQRERLVRLG